MSRSLREYDVPRTYVLKVSGRNGDDFFGEVRVDGQLHEVNGKTPSELEYQGLEVEFALALPSAKEGEKLVVEVFIDGKKAKYGSKQESENGIASAKYKSFGYSETFGGTSYWGDTDLFRSVGLRRKNK
jgi:hypothetical protein